jgi:hypothetical protein
VFVRTLYDGLINLDNMDRIDVVREKGTGIDVLMAFDYATGKEHQISRAGGCEQGLGEIIWAMNAGLACYEIGHHKNERRPEDAAKLLLERGAL